MNKLEKIVYMLSGEMTRPKSFGWFHLMWIAIIIISLVYLKNTKSSETKTKKILLFYGITALTLEILKQIIWAFNYEDNIVIWKYSWYSSPFQLCTTPIFVCLIVPFIKNKKIKNSMLSYLCYFTILGSISTILMPDSCFVKTIEVNIHTMFLHCMSFVVSIYLLMKEIVTINIKNVLKGYKVFLIFASIALILNIVVYKFYLPPDETFNMFYISPYFISSLPVYNIIQQKVPYIFFLLFYLLTILIGGIVIYLIAKTIKKLSQK